MNTPMNTTTDTVSTRTLLKATFVAMLVAAIILITAILPAEFGIDPTGVGRALGLTQMGEQKQQVATAPATTPAIADAAVTIATATTATPATPADSQAAEPLRRDRFTIELQPNQGTEYKATMKIGQSMRFSWATEQGELYFDFHGDPENAKNGEFVSYKESTLTADKGELKADFNGVHGWYWKNRSNQVITVQLETEGNYLSIGKVH